MRGTTERRDRRQAAASAAVTAAWLLAAAAVVGLHLWRRNTLLSIAAGTALYMVLVQAVFV